MNIKKSLFIVVAIAGIGIIDIIHADFTLVNNTDHIIYVEPYSNPSHSEYPACSLNAGQMPFVQPGATVTYFNGGKNECLYDLQALKQMGDSSPILINDSRSQFMRGIITVYKEGNNFRLKFQ